jgi:hypothetical protein
MPESVTHVPGKSCYPSVRKGTVIVVFPLVPDRGDRHGSPVLDFEECDVTGSAKRNDDFANPRIVAE